MHPLPKTYSKISKHFEKYLGVHLDILGSLINLERKGHFCGTSFLSILRGPQKYFFPVKLCD
jgi:hypothetical protein